MISNIEAVDKSLIFAFDAGIAAGGNSNITPLYDYLYDTEIKWSGDSPSVFSNIKIYVGDTLIYEHVIDSSNRDTEKFYSNNNYGILLRRGLKDIPLLKNTYSYNSQDLPISIYFYYKSGEVTGFPLGTVIFRSPILNNISLYTYGDLKTGFYVNDVFDCQRSIGDGADEHFEDAFEVRANYTRAVSGASYTTQVYNYTIIPPDMTTKGTKDVVIGFNGKTASYQINVYGVNSAVFSNINTNYRVGVDSFSYNGTVLITYDNNETETKNLDNSNVDVVPDMTTVGTKTFNVSTTTYYTRETVSKQITINVLNIQSISVTNNPNKIVYNGNESFDPTGIAVVANYGNGLINNITEDVTYSSIVKTTGEQDITVTYTNEYGTWTTTLKIYVNGILEPTLSFGTLNKITNNQNEYIGFEGYLTYVNNNKSTLLQQISMTFKERTYTSSGTYSDVNDSTNQLIFASDSIANGDNNATASYTKNGITINKQFIIRTFSYTKLEISGLSNKVYYGTRFEQNNIIVKGYNGEQLVKELPSSKYTVNISDNYLYPIGDTSVIFTSIEDSNITKTINVTCLNDEPEDDATLSVATGSDINGIKYDNKYWFNRGESIDLSNMNLVVSEMKSGATNVSLSPNEYSKRVYRIVDNEQVNKTGLTFTEDDPIDDYYLELSFKNMTPITYHLALNYVASVTVDTSTSKLKYKAGEVLNKSLIKGIKTYANGTPQVPFTDSEIADISKTFAKTQTGKEIVSLTICGIPTNVEFTIIYLTSASITLNKSAYNIHDDLDIDKITLTYSDTSTSDTKTDLVLSEILSHITWSNDFSITNMTFDNIRSTNQYTLTGTYTEEEETVTITTNITIKALSNVKITDGNANEIDYAVLDYNTLIKSGLAGYRIYYYFNDETYSYITIDNSIIVYNSSDRPIQEEVIKSRITDCYITYEWKVDNVLKDSLDCEFDIYCMKLASISLNWGNIHSIHYGGDILPFDSITNVVVNYSALLEGETDTNGDLTRTDTTKTYQNLDYRFSNSVNAVNYELYTPEANESYDLTLYATFTDGEQSVRAEKEITVYPIELDSLSVTYTGSYEFIEEQSLSISNSNTSITANFKNSYPSRAVSLDEILFYEQDSEDNYISFNVGKQLTLDDDGKTIYIGYKNYPDVFEEFTTLSVSAKQLSSIEIIQNPTKTSFTIGDLFSMKGIQVRATFDNLTTDIIYYQDLTASGSGLITNRPFEISDITNDNTSITVTVSYTYGSITKTATYPITLVYPSLAKARIDTSNVQTNFKNGDAFTSTGLFVYAVYENGYEERLTSSYYSLDTSDFVSSNVIVLPTNPDTSKAEYGLRVIPVTITNPHKNTDTLTNNTDYKITVTANSTVEQIWLDIDETIAKNYTVGDAFTAKGVTFMVKDGDGNEYSVDFYTNPAKNALLRKPQKLTVSVMYGEYTLKYDINVNVAYSDTNVTTTDYTIAIGDRNGNLFTSIVHDDTTIELGVKNSGQAIYPIFNKDDVTIDINQAHNDTYGFNVLNDVIANAASKCIGYMDMGLQDEFGNVIRNAHVVLFDDPINPIEADGNVIVKFPHYKSGYADRINKCTFGIIFNKHLFVSGNNDYKNCDWHTENINVAQTENYNQIADGDYTYFSDLDYCYYGTDDTAVVGYDIYRDGDLIVIKESSKTQATLYRREAKLITAIDSQGNTITGLYEDAYPSFDINFNGGDGALSNRSIINFMGDTLFLTNNGLKVVSSKDTTYNKEKIIYDVSSYINPRIIKENLKDAHLYSFNEKLILKTSRGVYIGEYTLRNDNKEYEWYFLDNINADVFFEYDNELYFMNDNGAFYKFSYNENEYRDNKRTFIGVGGTLLTNIAYDGDDFDFDSANDRIILSGDYADDVEEGVDFHLITNNNNTKSFIHTNIGSFIETNWRTNNNSHYSPLVYIGVINRTDNSVEIKPYNTSGVVDTIKQSRINDTLVLSRNIYIDAITKESSASNEPLVNTTYKLVKVNKNSPFDYKYYLYDSSGNKCNFENILTMRLSYILNEIQDIKIFDIREEGNGKSFQLKDSFKNVLDLIDYNNQNNNLTFSAVITKPKVISSYFITKPYDFGTILYEKTIWQWAITNDTELASYMDVGYLTNVKQADYSMVVKTTSGSTKFSLDEFNFDKIQFTSDKLPHIFNRFKVLSNIGFIRFIFRNNENSNIVLDKLSLIYTISQSIKGVK